MVGGGPGVVGGLQRCAGEAGVAQQVGAVIQPARAGGVGATLGFDRAGGAGAQRRDAQELGARELPVGVGRLVGGGGPHVAQAGLRVVGGVAPVGGAGVGPGEAVVGVEHAAFPAAGLVEHDRVVFAGDDGVDGIAGAVGGVHPLDVGDVDHPADATTAAVGIGAGAQIVDHHRAVGRVGDHDLAEAVEHLQARGAASGVEDLAVELDVAALDRFAVEHEAPAGHARVVAGADVAVVGNQRVEAAEAAGALRPAAGAHVGVGIAGVGFDAVQRGVEHHRAARCGQRGVLRAGAVLPVLDQGVERALVEAVQAGRAGEHRGGRQGDVPGFDAALDQAVDVQVARADEHAAIGHDALAGRRARLAALHVGGRVARGMVETVDKALHEVAVVGLHVDLCGADVAIDVDAAGLAIHAHQTERVAHVVRELDVGRGGGQVGVLGAVRVVVADHLDLRQAGAIVVLGLQRQARCLVVEVDAADLVVVVDEEAVLTDLAAAVAIDGEFAQHQEVGRVVDDADLRVARCAQRAVARQVVGGHVDVAQAHGDVVDMHEVGNRAVGGHIGQAGQLRFERHQVGLCRAQIGFKALHRREVAGHRGAGAGYGGVGAVDVAGQGAHVAAQAGVAALQVADGSDPATVGAAIGKAAAQGGLQAVDGGVGAAQRAGFLVELGALGGDAGQQAVGGAQFGGGRVAVGVVEGAQGVDLRLCAVGGQQRVDLALAAGDIAQQGVDVGIAGGQRSAVGAELALQGVDVAAQAGRRTLLVNQVQVITVGGVEITHAGEVGPDGVVVAVDAVGAQHDRAGVGGQCGLRGQCAVGGGGGPVGGRYDVIAEAVDLRFFLRDLFEFYFFRAGVVPVAGVEVGAIGVAAGQAELDQLELQELDLRLVGAHGHRVARVLLHQAAQFVDALLDVGGQANGRIDGVVHPVGLADLEAPQHAAIGAGDRRGHHVSARVDQLVFEGQRLEAVDAGQRGAFDLRSRAAAHHGFAAFDVEGHVVAAKGIADAADDARGRFAVDVLSDTDMVGVDLALVGGQGDVAGRFDGGGAEQLH